MFTMVPRNTRQAFSAVAAVAIVGGAGLVMDQAYLAAAPRGTIEIGELTALDTVQMAQVALPEVVVLGRREPHAQFAATVELPEIVVVAKRVAHMVAKEDDRQRLPTPAISAGF